MVFLWTTPSIGTTKKFSRYSEKNHCCCEAKWKPHFRVGRDARLHI